MPEKSLRRRVPSAGTSRKIRPPHPSPSPTRRSPAPRRPVKRSRPIKVLKRCLSEPALKTPIGDDFSEIEDQQKANLWPDADGGFFYRNRTCTDVCASSPTLISFSAPDQSSEGLNSCYNKESKVVVNVTVEGSPGPLRTMVKLGSNVEETIKVVIDKYCEEGRTPKLDDKSSSSYELHHSYFSLQSLDRAEVMGDIGNRSFYLRRSSSNRTSNGANSPPPIPPPAFLFPSLFGRKLGKIVRRSRRLWKVLVCWK